MELKTVFLKKLTTDKTDMKVASIVSYVCGLFIFGIGIFILGKFDMSVETMFLSFLILIMLFLQMIMIASILEVLGKLHNQKDNP